MPRKTDTHPEKDAPASTTSASSGKEKEKEKDNGVSIDDHTLPKSIVTRLAKGVLPQNTNVQKDAILALSKGGTVFINYLCAAANDQAKLHGRKTINPKDVLEAMEQLEFGEFLPRLEAELDKFNQLADEKRAGNRKPKDKDKGVGGGGGGDGVRDSPPAAKKMRVGGGKGGVVLPVKVDEEMGNEEGEGDEDEDEDEVAEEDDDEGEEADDAGDATETESEEEEEDEEEEEEAADREEDEDEDEDEDEALDNGVDSD